MFNYSQNSQVPRTIRKICRLARSQSGFSLLEVIIAIGIIVVALGSSTVLISKSVGRLSIPRNKIIAANLAAEGIEVTRNMRDSNWFETLPTVEWNDGFSSDGTYRVDYNSASVLGGGVTDQLYFDSATGFYSHNSVGTLTIFSRHIEILYPLSGDSEGTPYMEVKSIVDWDERGEAKQFILVDHLYDWF